MEDYQLAVIKEKQELDFKLDRLESFITAMRFQTLDLAEKERLQKQKQIMQQYSDILNERIENFR